MKQWEQSQANELTKIRTAQRHLIYNVVAYCAISVLEYWLAAISQSQTLRADAFNNLSGIICTLPRTFMMMRSLESNSPTASTRKYSAVTSGFSSSAGATRLSSRWSRRW